MSRYQVGQLVRIKQLQPYSYTVEGSYISAARARNSGKTVVIVRVIGCLTYSTYKVRNPRTHREYTYAYPDSSLIGCQIYKRQQH